MKGRPPCLGEKIFQLAEKGFYAVSLFLQTIGEGKVGFEERLLFFAEHEALAPEVKEESAQGLLGRRMNLNGDLDPTGVLRPG
jgi:hypothetical protein